MPLFDVLLRKHRDKTTLAILVVLSLILLSLPQRPKVRFAQVVLNAAFLPFERVAFFAEELGRLRTENRRFKRMVASLLLERERLTQYRAERERYRRLAQFREEQFLELVSCEVIGRNLDRFQTILVIDRGSADSLRTRMPVLSYKGYVGRVVEVFDNSAWVQLIASQNSPVSCLDKRSRVVGILEWRDHSYFDLSHVSVVEDVQVGDTLITSGYGGVAPKGFPIAVVTRVAPSMDGLSLHVEAKSDIDFRLLEEVFVVTDKIPWDRAVFYNRADSALIRSTIGVKR